MRLSNDTDSELSVLFANYPLKQRFFRNIYTDLFKGLDINDSAFAQL
jgi:hypothetical protein